MTTRRDIASDVHTLRDLSGRADMLTVACSRCDRRGRVSVHRLIADHGPDKPLPAILAGLAADCPRRGDGSWFDRCDPHFPDLPALLSRWSCVPALCWC